MTAEKAANFDAHYLRSIERVLFRNPSSAAITVVVDSCVPKDFLSLVSFRFHSPGSSGARAGLTLLRRTEQAGLARRRKEDHTGQRANARNFDQKTSPLTPWAGPYCLNRADAG